MSASIFFQKHCTPWYADIREEVIVIRDRDGKWICSLPQAVDQERGDQEATAQLLAMAPELFANLHALVDVMRRSDAEQVPFAGARTTDDEWDDALEDAQALLDVLADDGVTLGDAA